MPPSILTVGDDGEADDKNSIDIVLLIVRFCDVGSKYDYWCTTPKI